MKKEEKNNILQSIQHFVLTTKVFQLKVILNINIFT